MFKTSLSSVYDVIYTNGKNIQHMQKTVAY